MMPPSRSRAPGTSVHPSTSTQRRASALAAVLFVSAGAAACNGVLGLDAPRLDPCTGGDCVDATAPIDADAGLPAAQDSAPPVGGDAAPDAHDAAPDQGPIDGVRCGGGTTPPIGCANDTPGCCLVLEGGTPSYTCDEGAAQCSGYPILCATNNDCSGSEVCCHFASSIKCEDESACANGSLVCDPNGASDQCPTGWKCTAQYTTGAYTLPYYGCAQ